MPGKTFYDIHMHAFNLSHPYLGAFIRRFKLGLFLATSPLITAVVLLIMRLPRWPIIRLPADWIRNKFSQIKNLLAVMENDIGSVFLLLENCLRENGMLDNEGLHIGGNTYTRYVLTPLLMDFGYKGIRDTTIHYNEPCRKPIRDQVTDVFNAIRYYVEFRYSDKYADAFPHLKADGQGRETVRIFEIYPFIGINTKNYGLDEIRVLLDKYFKDYRGSREDLLRNVGKFDGDIDHLTSNFAAGVKLYPPLDFDPWPDDNPDELAKVKYLYRYCQEKGIPISVHGSGGGFVVVGKRRLRKITQVSKWEAVLSAYPKLKLNLAHFPVNERFLWIFPKTKRLKAILGLVPRYENVYVDFSCRALGHTYYESLKKLVAGSPPELRRKLYEHILFGSDFSVSLVSVESYNQYLSIFSSDSSFDDAEKDRFCSSNPESFLFSKSTSGPMTA